MPASDEERLDWLDENPLNRLAFHFQSDNRDIPIRDVIDYLMQHKEPLDAPQYEQ